MRHLTAINAGASAAAFALNILVVFVGYRFVVQRDGVAILGVLSLTSAWAFMARFADAGVATAITRRIANEPDAAQRLPLAWRHVLAGLLLNGPLAVLACSVAGGLLFFGAGSVAGQPNRQLVLHLLPPLLATVLAANLASIPAAALSGVGRLYEASLCSAAGTVLYGVLVLLFAPSQGVLALAYAGAAQQWTVLLLGTACVVRLKRQARLGAQAGAHVQGLCGQLLREGLPLQAGAIANALFEPLSKLLMGSLGNLALVGKYELALKMITLPRNLIMSGANALLPVMAAERDVARRTALYRQATQRVTWLAVAVLGGLALLSPMAGALWGLSQGQDLFWLASGLAVGYAVNCRGGVAYLLGQATARNKWNILSSVLALGLLLVAYWPASAMLGPQAFAWAVAVALAGSALFLKHMNERDVLLGG